MLFSFVEPKGTKGRPPSSNLAFMSFKPESATFDTVIFTMLLAPGSRVFLPMLTEFTERIASCVCTSTLNSSGSIHEYPSVLYLILRSFSPSTAFSSTLSLYFTITPTSPRCMLCMVPRFLTASAPGSNENGYWGSNSTMTFLASPLPLLSNLNLTSTYFPGSAGSGSWLINVTAISYIFAGLYVVCAAKTAKAEEKKSNMVKNTNNSFLILLLTPFYHSSIFKVLYPLRMPCNICIMAYHYYSFPFLIKFF